MPGATRLVGRTCADCTEAPQCKAAARRRLDQAADVLVQRLLNFALDDDASDNVALQAIIATLDRAGIVKLAQLDVAIGPRPFEQIFDNISGGSRAESRARQGMPDDGLDEWHIPALEAASGAGEGSEIEIVDAEVIDPEPKRTAPPSSSNAARASHAGRTTYGSVTASGHDRRESHGHDRPLGELVVRTQEVPNRVFVMKRGSAWVDTVGWLSLGTGLGPHDSYALGDRGELVVDRADPCAGSGKSNSGPALSGSNPHRRCQ